MKSVAQLSSGYSCREQTAIFFKKNTRRFIAQRVHRVCTRINYKIFPVTNLNKYLGYGTGGTE